MKKFFFRLETLLKVRKVREGRMNRELAYTQQKLSQWKEKETTLKHQIASLMDDIQKKRETGERALQDTYVQILDHLKESLGQVESTILAQERQIEEQQERLKRNIQERKVIEKIKEKHYSSWRSQSEQEVIHH